ncbi:MAG: 1-deoxy-D-xylulose-5-phosphate synthase, partial [Candidatus Omnitrophica bacterium]|nr:1-deoxy-D-xylulose-5-phosphate synthase [Candidatus Omnitrophota bacterium]
PNLIMMSPKDGAELKAMLKCGLNFNGPVSIRYPKSRIPEIELATGNELEIGKCEILREGKDLTIIAIGSMVYPSLEAAEILRDEGIEAAVINARFIKPIDGKLIKEWFGETNRVVTVEEGIEEGGFGSAILEFIESQGLGDIKVLRLGLPCRFIEHGTREILLKEFDLTPAGIVHRIKRAKWA